MNLKPKCSIKTTSIPCPITVQKSCYQNFAGCRCTVVAIDFPSNTYEWSATINLVCRISCCFWPLTDRARIAKWYSNASPTRTYLGHGLFRLTLPPRRLRYMVMQQAFQYWAVRYYHCAQYGRRTYGANMPHRQSLYHVTSWYSWPVLLRQALLS
jgi:hypothetical protein